MYINEIDMDKNNSKKGNVIIIPRKVNMFGLL